MDPNQRPPIFGTGPDSRYRQLPPETVKCSVLSVCQLGQARVDEDEKSNTVITIIINLLIRKWITSNRS